MPELVLQKIRIPDPEIGLDECVETIARGYFDWGYDEGTDRTWEAATPDDMRRVALRGYRIYDGCPVAQDNVLTASDIALSVGINSYVVLPDIRRFMARSDGISRVLEQCNPRVSLRDAHEGVITALGDLVDELRKANHIDISKITKVLHKKRPSLIPLIDSFVLDSLHKNLPWLVRGWQRTSFAKVIRAFRTAEARVANTLAEVTGILRREWAINLTHGRALSYLIWRWSKAMNASGRPCTMVAFWGSQGSVGMKAARAEWDAS